MVLRPVLLGLGCVPLPCQMEQPSGDVEMHRLAYLLLRKFSSLQRSFSTFPFHMYVILSVFLFLVSFVSFFFLLNTSYLAPEIVGEVCLLNDPLSTSDKTPFFLLSSKEKQLWNGGIFYEAHGFLGCPSFVQGTQTLWLLLLAHAGFCGG